MNIPEQTLPQKKTNVLHNNVINELKICNYNKCIRYEHQLILGLLPYTYINGNINLYMKI